MSAEQIGVKPAGNVVVGGVPASILLPSSPGASYRAHRAEIDNAVRAVLESGWYILGEEVGLFEDEFARYIGVGWGIGVASGTDALLIALRACGVGQGDAVITVSHTAVATVCAVELSGATPLLVDIDPSTFTLDLNRVEDVLKGELCRNIKAIVPVHLYGHPADMLGTLELARQYDLYVIEDCAQAHGAALQGRRVGSFGHFGAFSLYPTKNLGALGDGGVLVTGDAALADKARRLRQYGWKQRYISEIPGINSRLDELQAAVLRVKLRYLDSDNDRRRRIAEAYRHALSDSPFTLPTQADKSLHVYHQYVVRSEKRNELKRFLKRNSIETAVLYPVPVHLQPAYRNLGVGSGDLRETERVCGDILSLPMFPEMTDEQVSTVSEKMLDWARRRGGNRVDDEVFRPTR